MQLRESIEIERPAGEVFDFVIDPANDPKWCRNVVSSDLTAGTPGRPGARYRVQQGHSPVGRQMRCELLATDPPKRAELRLRTDVATFDVAYEVEETTRGTRLTQTSDVSFRGRGHLVRPIVRVVYPLAMRQQFTALKERLER